MPQITWTLTKQCPSCEAEVTFTSELGEKFKLSFARTEYRKFERAVKWVNDHPNVNDPREVPFDLEPYIWYGNDVTRIFAHGYHLVDEPKFYYVKCPVCKERIWIC